MLQSQACESPCWQRRRASDIRTSHRAQPPGARAGSPEGAEAGILGRGDVQRPAHLRGGAAAVRRLARGRPAHGHGLPLRAVPSRAAQDPRRAGARPAVHAVRADDDLGGKVGAVEELQRCLVCARRPRVAAALDPCPCRAGCMHPLLAAGQRAALRSGRTRRAPISSTSAEQGGAQGVAAFMH